jgi:hypothetical protein
VLFGVAAEDLCAAFRELEGGLLFGFGEVFGAVEELAGGVVGVVRVVVVLALGQEGVVGHWGLFQGGFAGVLDVEGFGAVWAVVGLLLRRDASH